MERRPSYALPAALILGAGIVTLLLIALAPLAACPSCDLMALDLPNVPIAKLRKHCDRCRATGRTTLFQSWKFRRDPPTRW